MAALTIDQALDTAVKQFKETLDNKLAEREQAHGEERAALQADIEKLSGQIDTLEKAHAEHLSRVSLPGVEYDADGSKEKQAFSLFRAMQLAAADVDPSRFGRFKTAASHGYEREVMDSEKRTYNVGTDEAGGVFVPQEVMFDSIVPQLEARSVVRKAGATTLNGLRGDLSWIVEEGGSVAYYVDSEGEESITESAETFSTLKARPHTMAAMQKFSHLQLMQSAIAIEPWARGRVATKFALKEDYSAIKGSGAGSEPRGLENVTGTNTATSGGTYTGASQTISALANEMIYDIRIANAWDPTGSYAFIAQPEVGQKFADALDADGRRLFTSEANPTLERFVGYPFLESTQFDSGDTSDGFLVFGDFSKLLLLQWGSMRIQAVQEGDDAKKLRMSIIGSMDHDILCLQPAAFTFGDSIDVT